MDGLAIIVITWERIVVANWRGGGPTIILQWKLATLEQGSVHLGVLRFDSSANMLVVELY